MTHDALDAPFWTQSLDHWHSMFDHGVRNHVITCHAAAPLFVRQKRGLIVTTSFWDRGHYIKGNLFYDLAKATMNRLAFALAEELRSHNVTSLAVVPGWMRTEIILAAFKTDEQHWRDVPPLARTESPRYLGRAVPRSHAIRTCMKKPAAFTSSVSSRANMASPMSMAVGFRLSKCSLVVVAACSSAPSKPAFVAPPAPPPADAAVDAASPDAGVPESAATWRFRYSTAQRTETWTLRFGEGHAAIDVQSAQGTLHYFGTATEGEAMKLDVAASNAKLSLDCKRAKRPLSTKCNDKKAKPVDVLDCYVAGFKEPMPFGEGDGVEYVVDASCNGFRLMAHSP